MYIGVNIYIYKEKKNKKKSEKSNIDEIINDMIHFFFMARDVVIENYGGHIAIETNISAKLR